jgi:adenine-specific DNA methylase
MSPSEIRLLRQLTGQSQSDFANLLGVTLAAISNWETGKAKPMLKMIKRLESIVQITKGLSIPKDPFRPIQYLGSKYKLVTTIQSVLDDLVQPGAMIGDLFSGSGVVGHSLARRYAVTSVDIQKYAEVLSKGLLDGRPEDIDCVNLESFWAEFDIVFANIISLFEPLLSYEENALVEAKGGSPLLLAEVIEHGSIASYMQAESQVTDEILAKRIEATIIRLKDAEYTSDELTVSIYFGGSYFSYYQAIAMDALDIVIKKQKEKKQSVLRAVLLSVASEIVNTVGKQFAQPVKLIKGEGKTQPLLLQRACQDRARDVKKTFISWSEKWRNNLHTEYKNHRVFCKDVIDFVEFDDACDIYYADPPYTIDHYSRFYHVLETLMLRDAPHLDRMEKNGESKIMRGIYRAGRYQSPFCIPAKAKNAYEKMLSSVGVKGKPLILSYSPYDSAVGNRPRLLSIEELTTIAKRYFREVYVLDINTHVHRKLNAKSVNVQPAKNAECIIVCKP